MSLQHSTPQIHSHNSQHRRWFFFYLRMWFTCHKSRIRMNRHGTRMRKFLSLSLSLHCFVLHTQICANSLTFLSIQNDFHSNSLCFISFDSDGKSLSGEQKKSSQLDKIEKPFRIEFFSWSTAYGKRFESVEQFHWNSHTHSELCHLFSRCSVSTTISLVVVHLVFQKRDVTRCECVWSVQSNRMTY